MNGQENPNAIYSNIQDIKEGIDGVKGIDCAEARRPRQKISAEEAIVYFAEVQSSLDDPTTRSAASCECAQLSKIADDDALPEQVRQRAAELRTIARDAA
jgi:hypothetical protein